MNDRTNRVRRVADLVEKREQLARTELSVARRHRDEAAHALQSVFLQCRDVVERPDEFSLKFGRGLIEAGWLAEQQRRSALEAAVEAAETKQAEWHHERTRVDALGRLIERLAELDAADEAKRTEQQLDDLVTARVVRAARA